MESLQEQMVIGDCYILQSRVAEDSCTEQWIATAIFSASKFLLRFIRPELLDSAVIDGLRRESLRNYNIRGPAVRDIVEIEVFDGRLFISSEYDGEIGLDRYLSSIRGLSLLSVCRCVDMLAQALQFFHESGLIFGNLNPESVLVARPVSDQPYMILLKPGLSTIIPALLLHTISSPAITAICACLSPEYKRGTDLYPGSDVYSLGVLFFRLLSGNFPYPDNCAEARTALASPRYVSYVLFALEVPERLIHIIIRMLIPDISRRYSSCLDFMRDLGGFLSSSPATETDRKKDVPYLRTFDSTGYFRSLQEMPGEDKEAGKLSGSLPALSDDKEHALPAKTDLRITEEEIDWTIDDYIDFGREIVLGIPRTSARRNSMEQTEPVIPRESVLSLPESSMAPAAPTVIIPPRVDTKFDRPPIDSFTAVHMLPERTSSPGKGDSGEILTADAGLNQVSSSPVTDDGDSAQDPVRQRIAGTWTCHRIRVQDVYPIVSRLAKRAERSKGSFRYIQEPESGYANTELYSSMDNLSKRYLYVNAGSCARYGTASTGDFLAMLGSAFSRALSGESPQSRAYLARKVAEKDSFGVFDASAAGNLRRLSDKSPIDESLFCNPDFTESIANALCAFARKKKPLVLVVRGGERIQRDLHDLFAVISRKSATAPLCIIVFYERIRFEPWHVLSRYLPNREI